MIKVQSNEFLLNKIRFVVQNYYTAVLVSNFVY